jgi:pyruvate/2-oxoglutarate/acetoin dehydrogenase E1 component
MTYYDAIKESMTWLGSQDNLVITGQGLRNGVFMSGTLDDVPDDKIWEFPVAESFNTQFAIGAALSGLTVVLVIPRINFLLIAFADIVNLLDKLPEMTDGKVNPHVIIRTAIGPDSPINPKIQHVGDYTEAFLSSLNGVCVYNDKQKPGVRIYGPTNPEDVVIAYQSAYNKKEPCLVIEDGRLYNE